MTVMKESIPPILRPDSVTPVALSALAARFGLGGEAPAEVAITGISMNTADLRPGDLFVAMPGLKTHGARFTEKALAAGAVAIVTDQAGRSEIEQTLGTVAVPILLLEEPRKHLGNLAAFVYGNVAGNLP
ncbi:MAG: hypothetical protein RL454_152, partial [Actinomycetota bacterium]